MHPGLEQVSSVKISNDVAAAYSLGSAKALSQNQLFCFMTIHSSSLTITQPLKSEEKRLSYNHTCSKVEFIGEIQV